MPQLWRKSDNKTIVVEPEQVALLLKTGDYTNERPDNPSIPKPTAQEPKVKPKHPTKTTKKTHSGPPKFKE